jgi:hypothetical protein
MIYRFALVSATLVMLMPPTVAKCVESAIDEAEASRIAIEAYHWLYPLVTMDVSRRQLTNIEAGKMPGRGPMNSFAHMRAFPEASFRDVVRPNFDTLYSSAWLDLTNGPVVVSMPDTEGRYYLLPMLDLWTDVFASPGKRTTGTGAGNFVVVPPDWRGTIPQGMSRIDSPTPFVWLIGRIQTNGTADLPAVHAIQDAMRIVPLEFFGRDVPKAAAVAIDHAVDMKTPPLRQVHSMTGTDFFARAATILKENPPHITDQPIVARLRRLGFEVGKPFDAATIDLVARNAINAAPKAALAEMQAKLPTLARTTNGWQMNTDTMGVYGNSYLKRAIVAMVGLGANLPEDAIYPLNIGDSEGRPLDGHNRYRLRFRREELPPVDAFWSVTLYDPEGFQVENDLGRFAIGDRDQLTYAPDGGLELVIQADRPPEGEKANWLPAPRGPFNLTMRLYAPKPAALQGGWNPPAVTRVAE